MKPRVIVPNIFTSLSLACGLFVIFQMTQLPDSQVNYNQFLASALILLFAAFLDFLDGAFARVLKGESEFGGFFDSMADAVAFGVAPATLIIKSIHFEPRTLLSFFVMAGALCYVMAGELRLVRFTIGIHKPDEKPIEDPALRKSFTGLPITAAAACLTSLTLLLLSAEFTAVVPLSEIARASIIIISLFLLAFLMVSKLKFPSFKNLRFKVSSFLILLLTTFTAALLLGGLVNYFPFVFAAISWLYVFVSLLLSLIRVISGKRIKALEDFEPDSEDE